MIPGVTAFQPADLAVIAVGIRRIGFVERLRDFIQHRDVAFVMRIIMPVRGFRTNHVLQQRFYFFVAVGVRGSAYIRKP